MKSIQKQIISELKRDKKKAVMLAVLFCVAAVVIGKLLISDSQPAPAVAAPVAALPTVAQVEKATADGLTLDEYEKSASRDRYLKELDTNIKRDIFKPTPGLFPSQRNRQAAAVAGQADDENRIVFEQSKNLTLQSTVFGATPTAIVNNRILKKGDTINGFLVVEIKPSSVLLEKNGSKVLIWMKEQSLEK